MLRRQRRPDPDRRLRRLDFGKLALVDPIVGIDWPLATGEALIGVSTAAHAQKTSDKRHVFNS
jgi:hypothetical protein